MTSSQEQTVYTLGSEQAFCELFAERQGQTFCFGLLFIGVLLLHSHARHGAGSHWV